MLIKLEFEDNVISDKIDILTRGNIILQGKQGVISSKKMKNNQSSMIFLSLVELLDGIRLFIRDKNRHQYNYVAVDSSFQFYLVRKTANILRIENSKRGCIEEIDEWLESPFFEANEREKAEQEARIDEYLRERGKIVENNLLEGQPNAGRQGDRFIN